MITDCVRDVGMHQLADNYSSHDFLGKKSDIFVNLPDSFSLKENVQVLRDNYIDQLKIVHLNAQSLNDNSHYEEFLDVLLIVR